MTQSLDALETAYAAEETGKPDLVAEVRPIRIETSADRGVTRPRDLPNLHASSLGLLAIDSIVAIVAALVSSVAYQRAFYGVPGDLLFPIGVGAIVGIAFATLVRMKERSNLFTVSTDWGRARTALTMWVCSFGILLAFLFLFKQTEQISRGATILYFFFGGFFVVMSRVYTPRAFDPARHSKDRKIVFVGSASDPSLHMLGEEVARRLLSMPVVIGVDAACDDAQWQLERQRLSAKVRAVSRHRDVDQICLDSGHMTRQRLADILADFKVVPKAVVLIPDGFFASYMRNPVVYLGSQLGIEIQKNPLSRMQRISKRLMDIVLSSALLFLLSPLLITVALLINIDSKGPVLFRQMRKGLGGDPFPMVKFRTMTVMEDGNDVVQAGRDDPRFTRVGKWLRRTSIDELPQLWNVLRGEMSLVGPRPHALAHDEYFAQFINNYEFRQYIKPGITGWAQVNGLRGGTPTIDHMLRRIDHDVWYATNASLLLDMKILLLTAVEILRQRNAY